MKILKSNLEMHLNEMAQIMLDRERQLYINTTIHHYYIKLKHNNVFLKGT